MVRDDVDRARFLDTLAAMEAVLQHVARDYGLAVPDLVRPTRRPNEARQVALYGLRRWAGEALSSIARRMGMSYSAVSRRVGAVARRLAQDTRVRLGIERVSDVKVKT